jgi:tetratricopeptide (TPR) repeat protein
MRRRDRVPWRGFLAIAAVAVLGVASALVWKRLSSQQPPFAQLAEAYSKHRTLELRIAGAAYGELRVELGVQAEPSPELLESLAVIEKHLEKNPADVPWLLAKGRAALLERRTEDAIQALELARNLDTSKGVHTQSEILTDLATAYAQRAEAPGRAIDYQTAIEDLNRAIQIDSRLEVAYFNRALVYEKSYSYVLAISDWKHYLELDPKGPWADEARRHLAELESRVHLADPQGTAMADLLELQADRAMRASLPRDESVPLASRMRAGTGDRWMADAMHSLRGGSSGRVVRTLARMAESRALLRIDLYPAELEELHSLERVSMAEPFRVWLEFERVFRGTHSPGIGQCGESVDKLADTSRQRQYFWFLTQILLERSSCEMARGQLAAAEASDRQAVDIAIRHEFPVARLRAAGFLTGRLANGGRYREAAQLQYESLALFWSRPLPYQRAQEFYHDLVWIDEGFRCDYAAKSAAEEAAWMAHATGVLANEAANWARAAGFALRLGLTQEANENSARSRALFARLKSTGPVEEYRAFAEAMTPGTDTTLLLRFESAAQHSTNPLIIVPYLRALAFVSERNGNREKAREFLLRAIRALESNAPAVDVRLLEWRFQLQESYRDLVRLSAERGDAAGAYGEWQEFLRADYRLQGLREPELVTDHRSRPATLVTYARLGSRYAAWVRSGQKLRFAWIDSGSASIDRRVRAFAALCAEPSVEPEAIASLGASIRADLLDPFLSAGTPELLLLIQPDGDLKKLPWSALPLADGRSVAQHFLIAIVPTPVPKDGPIELPTIPVGRSLVVAATTVGSQFASEFPPLPGLTREVAAVRAAWPKSAVLDGSRATVAEIEKQIGAVEAVHFAGHTIMSGGHTFFVVAPDPSAQSSESAAGLWNPISSVPRTLRMAVLSACSTGRYGDPEQPDPDSLASGLLLSGTRLVVASLWNTDSTATSRFMQLLYQKVSGGEDPLLAMREASAESSRDPHLRNPYYWALFCTFLRL